MAGKDTSTGLNVFSFILSIVFFILMIILMLFPLFLLRKTQSEILEITVNTDKLSFFKKLTNNYVKGLKLTRMARLYNFVFIFRRLILAILIVCSDKKEVQLIVFIVLNVLFTTYMALVRPFTYKTQNFIALFNELILLVCCFWMFSFFATGDAKSAVGILMIVLFSINIVVCFTVAFIFQIYLFCHKRNTKVIEVFKDGEMVRYQTQKPAEEESNTKNEVELKRSKHVAQQNEPPAAQNASIIQPYMINEEMKVEVHEDKIGKTILLCIRFVK